MSRPPETTMSKTGTMSKTSGVVGLFVISMMLPFAGCSSDEPPSIEAFCSRFVEFEDAAVDGIDEAGLLAALRDLREVAPDDIVEDLDSTIEAYSTMKEFGDRKQAGEEIDDRDPALVAASARLDQGGTNLTTYVGRNCDRDVGS